MSDSAGARPAVALLAGLLCDEEIWGDVASRLERVARVTIIGFRGLS